MSPNTSLLDSLKTCFRTSVPITAIASPDQVATQRLIADLFTQKRPLITWDLCTGMLGLNEKGRAACTKAGAEPVLTQNPVEALNCARKFPEGSVVFMRNVHLFLDQPSLVQAIANVRDAFKANERMLIALGTTFVFPPEIARDVILLDEPLPTEAQIARVVLEQFRNASLEKPTDEIVSQCARILLGCSLFEAEQLAALSLTPQGMDQTMLFARKRQLIAQTPGLSLADPSTTIGMVGGHDALISRMTRVVNGRAKVGALLFIDEIEKSMAGAQGDTSGVSGDQHGYLLSWVQDNGVLGVQFEGCPGSGKTLSAMHIATLKRSGLLPFVKIDMGAMKSSLVGSSETRFRNALKVARALTEDTILLIATTNDNTLISPELRSRMTLGTYHFEPPDLAERSKIWPIYLSKYGLGTWDTLPTELKEAPWTGREIRACCEQAWNEGDPDDPTSSLLMASKNIVPVTITDAERLTRLREAAHNAFLSTAYPGVFDKNRASDEILGTGARNIRTEKDAWNL